MISENITISKEAIEALKKSASNNAVRLGVLGSGGCNGFSYAMDFDPTEREGDHKFSFDGLTLLIDKKSFVYVNGITVSYEKSLMKRGFVFSNPQEKSRCGCGKSFSI
jgi:iron-sulfur cluster assembly protein